MASSSSKLTKYKSAVTIVTADVANSWFGGLYGSGEASGLDANDPRVAGHVHDGQHLDGHAQKIDLVDHVTNQLRNVNLADNAVTARNVRSFTNQSSAIPEYEVIDSTTYYYLDLSDLRSSLTPSDKGSPSYVYYRPGGTEAGNVYTDFATAYAEANSINSEVVYFVWDTTLNDGVLSIPSGTYDMSNIIVLVDGPNDGFYSTSNNNYLGSTAVIEFEDGAILNNLGGLIGNCVLVNKSTTSIPLRFNLAGTSPSLYQTFFMKNAQIKTFDYTTFTALPTNQPVIFVNTNFLQIIGDNVSIGGGPFPAAIRVASGSTLGLYLTRASELLDDSLVSASGTASLAITVDGSSQINRAQSSWHTNPLPISSNYYSVRGAVFYGADGVDDGARGLVPAPASTDNTRFLRGDGIWATPSGTGEVNTGANVGAATGEVFRDKTGATLNFKTLNPSTGIAITNNADTIDITNDGVLSATNLGAGEGIFTSVLSNSIRLKSLVAGTDISLSSDASTITINSTSTGEANTGANVGAATGEVFRDKTGTTLNFKTLNPSTGIAITNNANTIDITNDGVLGATNLGVGEGLFTSVTSNNIQLKSLIGGTNVSLVSDATSITINATDTGEVNTGANVGAATGEVFRDKAGTTLNFKTLNAGTGMSITNNADTIDITNDGVLGATNLGAGAGEGLFTSVSGNNIQLKSLVAGTNVSLVSSANTITINSTGTPGAFTLDTTATPDLVRQDVSGAGDYTTNDFVFGSPSLSDTGTAGHDSRFLFDKSAAAFRAGSVTETQWDTRGNYSFATGLNNTCSSTGSVALAGNANSISGVGNSGFALMSQTCTITNVTRSGVVASLDSDIIGTFTNSVIIGGNDCEATANYAAARGILASADSQSKMAIGAGGIAGRGRGSAQGGVYVAKGRVTAAATVDLQFEAADFNIPNDSFYNVDIDIAVIENNGGTISYGGGKAHSFLIASSTGDVKATNNGLQYGTLAGYTVELRSAGVNVWNVRVVAPGARTYIEVVAHIRTTEIIAAAGALNVSETIDG